MYGTAENPERAAMSDIEARIAEVLRRHCWHEARMECTCSEGGGVPEWSWSVEGWSVHVAGEVVAALTLTEERELAQWSVSDLGEGIEISSSGTTTWVNCHICEKSPQKGFSPREAFDWAMEHANQVHGVIPQYRRRSVSQWILETGDLA